MACALSDNRGPKGQQSCGDRFFAKPRSLPVLAANGWRAQPRDSRFARPSFRLHTIAFDSEVRATLTTLLAGRPFEAVLPNDWTQHLVDAPLVEAFHEEARHKEAVHAVQSGWQVLAVSPFASYFVGRLGLLGGAEAHHRRMHELRQYLSMDPFFVNSSLPFLLLQP